MLLVGVSMGRQWVGQALCCCMKCWHTALPTLWQPWSYFWETETQWEVSQSLTEQDCTTVADFLTARAQMHNYPHADADQQGTAAKKKRNQLNMCRSVWLADALDATGAVNHCCNYCSTAPAYERHSDLTGSKREMFYVSTSMDEDKTHVCVCVFLQHPAIWAPPFFIWRRISPKHLPSDTYRCVRYWSVSVK